MSGYETNRRGFLRAAGAAGVGASLIGCTAEDHYAHHKPPVPGADKWMRGEERHVATSCGQCEAGCGIQVRVVEGRAVKVSGSPDCPINRGGVGPRGLASLQALYDPDRITSPLKRKGPRGSGEWEAISWEDALGILGGRLAALREAEEPQRLGVICGRERGFMLEFWKRFATAFGTPNMFDAGGSSDGAQIAALNYMQGITDKPAYDWENARFVLSLGSGVLDASCQMLHFVRARGREYGRDGRARIVHVGPVQTRTAINADDWIQARPGTHAAFVLGVAHVLVRDELHDKAFVEQHTHGFRDWTAEDGREHIGFASLLEGYTPQHVAEICAVSPAIIEKVAHAMAEHGPAFALIGQEELRSSNGVQSAMAVHALNALLGAIDRPGGLLVEESAPLADWPEVEPDSIAEAGLEHESLVAEGNGLLLESLPSAIMGAQAGSLDTLLLYYSNPAYSRPRQDSWRESLAAVPFIATFTPYLDETSTEFADLILPDDSWLERWEDAAAAPSIGAAVFSFRQPVIERLYDTRHTGDVLIGLASDLGDEVADAFPWKDFRSAFKSRIIGLYKSKSGSIVEKKGSAFLKSLYRAGFWYGDDYTFEQWERVLKTKSGRLEFFSDALWKSLGEKAAQRGLTPEQLAVELGAPDVANAADRFCMPDYREMLTQGDSQAYPLLLLPYKPSTYVSGTGTSLPWLAELTPWKGRPVWTTEVELHPDTAEAAGIQAGDTVTVESPVGQIKAKAYLTSGTLPNIARIAQGAGHTAYGRFAEGWGANVMELISAELSDPLGGSAPLHGMRVAIRRAEG